MTRCLHTASGSLVFPAFLPVTTFGGAFPLDELVRPYLARISPATMVSYHYAKCMKSRPKEILFVDSGGFASLFEGATIEDFPDCSSIRTKEGDVISPKQVLRFQEKHADIGATLDFIIPPHCPIEEAERRQQATLRNAIWAIQHRRRHSLRLYASVQAWDAPSARNAVGQLAQYDFDGLALGGMIPRIRSPETICEIVSAIREVDETRPLHVFGVGAPELVRRLITLGVDSVDSSNYVRAAVDGTRLEPPGGVNQCACVVCKRLGPEYGALEGEANRMALALHNLAVVTWLTTEDRSAADVAG